ncbi:MAG: ABC transporter ATP-binding protein [Oscillospiraceae bacterium]|jgi:peptide/nickel transport system ATP-binding protein|nr:ABC transporter ATP-binding protein [Oscillospiraceae bacterium]
MAPLLEIRDLTIQYKTYSATLQAVNGVNLELKAGSTLGLVGETGAGKTTTALGILRLVPSPPGEIVSGEILFEGEDLLRVSQQDIRRVRGNDISMIFQDPMTALNPTMKVGDQIAEVIARHEKCSRLAATKRSLTMLEMVGIPAERSVEYPHQFSGGMKQRVVIAIALACSPKLLIADEPTTALDVTIQAQVLEMINDLKEKIGTSVLLITHDLGIVAECCDDVAIMYAGEIVEYGTVEQVFENVRHPYTKGLFGSLPSLEEDVRRLNPIPGLMPDPGSLPPGCRFHDRCGEADELCAAAQPEYLDVGDGHFARCLRCVPRVNKGEAAIDG